MKSEQADVSVSDALVRGIVEFHGHLGPFLVLGTKAGLLANSLLGKDCVKTTAVVMTDTAPPNSCFADGVQFTTGCTTGKGNIKLGKSQGVSALFSKENRKIKLTVKKDILDYVKSISSEEASKKASLNLLKKPAHELFEIER